MVVLYVSAGINPVDAKGLVGDKLPEWCSSSLSRMGIEGRTVGCCPLPSPPHTQPPPPAKPCPLSSSIKKHDHDLGNSIHNQKRVSRPRKKHPDPENSHHKRVPCEWGIDTRIVLVIMKMPFSSVISQFRFLWHGRVCPCWLRKVQAWGLRLRNNASRCKRENKNTHPVTCTRGRGRSTVASIQLLVDAASGLLWLLIWRASPC